MPSGDGPGPPGQGQEPIRTCIGCRRRFGQKSLLRVSNHPEQGAILVDKGAAPGRSAYVCPNERCIVAALGKGRFARALKTAVPQDRLDSIKKELICKLQ